MAEVPLRVARCGTSATSRSFVLSNELTETIMVDNDRVEGAAKNIGGKIKEAAGKVTGDEKLKREGQADQVTGKVQNTVGGIKDKLREKDDEKNERH
jgi:uncharacterized protein YjbJ (UPF0337 family)